MDPIRLISATNQLKIPPNKSKVYRSTASSWALIADPVLAASQTDRCRSWQVELKYDGSVCNAGISSHIDQFAPWILLTRDQFATLNP